MIKFYIYNINWQTSSFDSFNQSRKEDIGWCVSEGMDARILGQSLSLLTPLFLELRYWHSTNSKKERGGGWSDESC